MTPQNTILDLATPTTLDSGDGNSVTVGVKFTASANGSVTGIRFYKALANTGSHVGDLWTSSGTVLASATFTSETATGWQQVNFATPVAITAGTTYVAGYFAPKGHYSSTASAFSSGGITNGPLQALPNSTSVNGVYIYNARMMFPTTTYSASNYWVDLLFSPGS